MAKDWGKRPVARFDPHPTKQARTAATPTPAHRTPAAHAPSFNNDTPSWRISKIEMADPFGWHEIDGDKLADVRGKLAQFEAMTWNEILVAGKKQNHSITVADLSKEARERLHVIGLGDVEMLVSLRLSNKERVWGLRQGAALLILWWDPDHAVCPSLMKHT